MQSLIINLFIIGLLGCSLDLPPVESFQPASQISAHYPGKECAFSVWGSASDRYTAFRLLSMTGESSFDAKVALRSDSKEKSSKYTIDDDKLTMPWSDTQNSVLLDNLAKYMVMIPLKSGEKEEQESQVFALWRTMLKEIPELAGYPIDFLQQMHERQIQNNQTLLEATPALLPYLEDYEFASAGGVSGEIYGVPGLADGTRIETSSVTNIEVTLPQGFVRTSDGSAAYEVGRPKREEFLNSVSVDEALAQGGELLKNVKNVGAVEPITVQDGDGMLVRLGTSTAILLAGATAVNMLSHHMTVNVFWV
jgi:hypothetical protein